MAAHIGYILEHYRPAINIIYIAVYIEILSTCSSPDSRLQHIHDLFRIRELVSCIFKLNSYYIRYINIVGVPGVARVTQEDRHELIYSVCCYGKCMKESVTA